MAASYFQLTKEEHIRNTLITIVVSLVTVWISLPLCTNTFVNLVQGLSPAHAELLAELKKELVQKTQGRVLVVESQFWMLDMSCIVGSMKIKMCEPNSEQKLNPQEPEVDWIGEVKKVYCPYVSELTVQDDSTG